MAERPRRVQSELSPCPMRRHHSDTRHIRDVLSPLHPYIPPRFPLVCTHNLLRPLRPVHSWPPIHLPQPETRSTSTLSPTVQLSLPELLSHCRGRATPPEHILPAGLPCFCRRITIPRLTLLSPQRIRARSGRPSTAWKAAPSWNPEGRPACTSKRVRVWAQHVLPPFRLEERPAKPFAAIHFQAARSGGVFFADDWSGSKFQPSQLPARCTHHMTWARAK